MSTEITGGCLCGTVRYVITVAPVMAGNCHCDDCRKASGGVGASAMMFPEDAITVTGVVKYFDSTADSGGTTSRGFCPECGSRLLGKMSKLPGMMSIAAGSLDDPGLFKPSVHVFVASAPSWVPMNPDLPKVNGMPDMGGGDT